MENKASFFDKPENIKILKYGFYVSLGILVILDFFVHKHTHVSWEKIYGSYAMYGFLSCAVIVAVSKTIGKLWLQKKEDYYD